jgi:hypothetical protein
MGRVQDHQDHGDEDSPSLRPLGGFAASASGALVLFYATAAGIPVSTTAHHHRLESWVSARRGGSVR